MKKFISKVLLITLCACLIVGLMFVAVFKIVPPAYSNSYCKGMVKQYRALQSADENQPKIIIWGGSYMAFSVDPVQMEEVTGYPTYCMGMYDSLGFSYPLELLEEHVSEGDVVVFPFSPFEKNDYGMSLIMMALEGEDDLLTDFVVKHPGEALRTIGGSIYTKLFTLAKGSVTGTLHGEQIDVYDARSFDDVTGALTYDRPEPTGEDALNQKYEYLPDNIDESCFEELNMLNELCQERGATLIVTWPPFYEDSVATDGEGMAVYQQYVAEHLDANIISTFESNETTYDQLYNGVVHLNNDGMRWYTNKLGNDINDYLKSKIGAFL